MKWFLAFVLSLALGTVLSRADEPRSKAEHLPRPGTLLAEEAHGEIILCATVQHPKGKPCIDDWGERIQALSAARKRPEATPRWQAILSSLSMCRPKRSTLPW